MGFARISGFVLTLFAAAGVAGFWQGAAAPILLVGFLFLPGAALSSLVCDAQSEAPGPGRLAFAASASLALLVPGVLPLFLLGAPLESATWSLAAVYAAVGAAALMFGRREASQPDTGAWWSFIVAAAVLLPAVVHYSGGTVDDWWDLAFIRGYLNSGSLTFAEPVLGTERIHPRFGWNSWLVMQSLVARYSQVPPEALHNPWLAVTASLLGLAAVDRLAVAIFGFERKVARYAALLFVPAWLWGTEALPYFTRCYQDKFVAGLILAPTMIAAAVTALRLARVRDYAAFGIATVATVAVHGVVFAVAALGTAIVCCGFVYEHGSSNRDLSLMRNAQKIAHPSAILAAMIGVAGLYPLWQAATLYSRFSGQGISLATPDNPVVRAHLALGRLIGVPNPAYIVNPEAVFGAVVVVAVFGAVVAAKGRRRGDRVLLCLAVLPARRRILIESLWCG